MFNDVLNKGSQQSGPARHLQQQDSVSSKPGFFFTACKGENSSTGLYEFNAQSEDPQAEISLKTRFRIISARLCSC